MLGKGAFLRPFLFEVIYVTTGRTNATDSAKRSRMSRLKEKVNLLIEELGANAFPGVVTKSTTPQTNFFAIDTMR